jgi:hypothetical protein
MLVLLSCNSRLNVDLSLKASNPVTLGITNPNGSFLNADNKDDFPLSGSCSTPDAVIEIEVDSVVVGSTTCNSYAWSAILDLSAKPDGPVSINVVEGRGTETEKSMVFEGVVDATPPASVDASTTSSTEYNLASSAGSFVISGSCSEEGTIVELSGAGIVPQQTTCLSGTYSLSTGLIGAADGTLPLQITLFDAAMNSTSTSLSVTKDTTPPTMTVPGPGATATSQSPISVTVSFDEPVADFTAGDLILTNSSLTSFTGNSSTSYTIEITPTAEGIAGFVIPALSLEDALQNPNSQSSSYSVIYDVTAPATTGLASDASSAEARTWNWGCTEGSNCTYRFLIDSNPTSDPTGAFSGTSTATFGGNGTYYLHIQARDAAGNVSATEHYSYFFEDLVAPVLSSLSNDSNVTKSKTHTLNCVDASPCTYRYVIDQSPTTLPTGGYSATSSVTTTTGDGVYYIHAQARDSAGNESTVAHASFVMDTTTPVLTGLSNDAIISKTKSWSWGCTDVNDCTYRYVIDQAPTTTPSGGYGTQTSASIASGDGTYYLHVQVQDEAGNNTLQHFSVTLDNTAPVLTGLFTDAVISKSKTWSWGCLDNNTCTYRYLVDQNPTSLPTGGFGATTTETLATGEGIYYIHVEATDPAGNSSIGHYSVTLDNTAPTVLGLTDDSSPTASKSWSWSCSDSVPCTYRYIIDTNPTTAPTGAYSATTSAVYSAGFGYYYLHVQATDQAGNASAVRHVSAILNATMQSGGDVLRMSQYTGDGGSSKALNYVGYSPQIVWIKDLSGSGDHQLFLSALGAGNSLSTNTMDAVANDANSLLSFTGLGFTVGSSSQVNSPGQTYAGWALKENTNFMDVITYSGNGTHSRAINHSLGTSPGMIMIKNLSTSSDWVIYQKDLNSGETEPAGAPVSPTRWVLNLNSPSARTHVEGAYFTNTVPTSTQFTLGSHAEVNSNSDNFVAVLFADDTSDVVKSGLYSGNGSASGPSITLGYEPQWVMIKRKDSSGDWKIIDANRSPTNPRLEVLEANTDGAQATITGGVLFTATGFEIKTANPDYNASGGQYIYLVIGK